ncbi:hypothetical protein DLAC_01680 [Tieghemostelium lacteum]|uniref:RING-CH-type domain-containing protein n=1 Tax=Tieghemostelium lacteum TaxID=361077 RepID=A0A152A614_TIELA|nr:hypothetical protein DLAC_01680 [Tieghemostelium lacteum]|eukprot:KYR01676.1 hypothetical protein DLAC_01680 [Tieghemostelium lacteum]
MFIECKFCLEEIEVEFPKPPPKLEESGEEESDFQNENKLNKNGDSQQYSTPQYLELVDINRKKRKNDIGHKLIQPCDCRGTQKFVHVKCLCEWIGKSNKWYCQICHRVYNMSPHQLHFCVLKLQRKGSLKSLPPLYTNSEFSRSSYFALLIFMGTLSMLMLPSTLNQHANRYQHHHYNNHQQQQHSNPINSGSLSNSQFSLLSNPLYINQHNPNHIHNNQNLQNSNTKQPYTGDKTISFYPSSSSPAIYSPTGKYIQMSQTVGQSVPSESNYIVDNNLPYYHNTQQTLLSNKPKSVNQEPKPITSYQPSSQPQQIYYSFNQYPNSKSTSRYPKDPIKDSLKNIFCTFFQLESICS